MCFTGTGASRAAGDVIEQSPLQQQGYMAISVLSIYFHGDWSDQLMLYTLPGRRFMLNNNNNDDDKKLLRDSYSEWRLENFPKTREFQLTVHCFWREGKNMNTHTVIPPTHSLHIHTQVTVTICFFPPTLLYFLKRILTSYQKSCMTIVEDYTRAMCSQQGMVKP